MKNLYKAILANFLHWGATRLHRVVSRIATLIIKYAISLTPRKQLFVENLQKIGYKYSTIYDHKAFLYCSLAQKNIEHVENFSILSPQKSIKLPLPKNVSDFKINPKHECTAVLPSTYLAEINNVQMFAETDLIISGNKVFYDEIDKDEINNYAIKSPNISKITNEKITVKIPVGRPKTITTGIHFTKNHSKNYFHWIIEALPRISLISGVDKNVPLLVSSHLPIQFYDALDILNTDKRKIIKLDSDKSYLVKKLFYPSPLSIVHDNYKTPIYHKDAVYSPEGINFVREAVLSTLEYIPDTKKRKIFISRNNSDYRQLLNADEIENVLIKKGFEIVFPEKLSFAIQVQIFSQAEIIIGQSGAGMTNFIFAPKNCQVIMMMSDVSENNLNLFNALAVASDTRLEFIIGKHVISRINRAIHTDFYVEPKLLENSLDQLYKS